MVLKTWRALLALGLLFAPVSARAASEYPLVITGGKIVQLPSADSIKLRITGSVQCVHVDTSGVLTGTGADCGSSSGTVTGITAGTGLSGGTITTSGTIAISTNGVTLGNIAQSAANTMLGNWTAGTANVAANAMPACADSGGNHLNYVGGTGITCGTSGATAGTVTSSGSPVSGDYAKFTSSTNITTASVSGSGALCLVTSCAMTTPALGTPSALVLTNASGLPLSALPATAKKRAFGCTFGDTTASSAVTVASVCYVAVPYACTISAWDMALDAGTATIDVWMTTTGTAVPTVANTITASALPAISTGTAKRSTTLTGWTTAVVANNLFGFSVNAIATAKFISVNLECDL